jgi:hypothetical protein
MNKADLIKKELAKRQEKQIDFTSYCFEQQKNAILDPSPYKCIFTTRRAGKSTTVGVYMIKTALENPNCNILYLGLSKDTASGAIWKDILYPIIKQFDINVKFTNKQITFSNGSIIIIRGTNSNKAELSKVLGQKYLLVILDECQSYDKIDTELLVYSSLAPTIQDMQGTIVMCGTPTDDTSTFFYDVTKQDGTRAPGWKVHEWNTFQNIIPQSDGLSQAEKSKLDIKRFEETIPNIYEVDWFRQQYLGKWTIRKDAKVYRYHSDLEDKRNRITDSSVLLTLRTDKNWFFVLGIDFGWTDATAFCVLAYHRHDPNIYIVQSEKHTHWTTTDLANRAKALDNAYHFTYMVGDSAAAQSIADLRKQHGLNIRGIEKPGKKWESISIMNADFITGRIKIDTVNNEDLVDELTKLIWDPTELENGTYKELKKAGKSENHICDAMLYAYRASRHYDAQTPEKKIDFNSPQDRLKLMLQNSVAKESDIYAVNSLFHEEPEEEKLFNFEQMYKKTY